MKRVLQYKGDATKIRKEGLPFWLHGDDVQVSYAGMTLPYFNFLCVIRLHNDEPLEELIKYMKNRSRLKLTYARHITNWINEYARILGVKQKVVRHRFAKLLYKKVQPGTSWK